MYDVNFCLLSFFWEKIEFLRNEINFRSAFLHEYPWVHSWIHSWCIYVGKTLIDKMTISRRFISNYTVISGNTVALIIVFERRCLRQCAAVFLRISGAMCSLTI